MSIKTIYLLEDDHDIQTLVSNALEKNGYRILSFSTVHTFNRKVLEHLPDLFIIDLTLPDGNGGLLTEHLAARRAGPSPPVIVMSADIKNGKNAIANGAQFFLPKPFQVDALLAAVKHLLHA